MTKTLNIEALEAYLREEASRSTLSDGMDEDEGVYYYLGSDVDDCYDAGEKDGGILECRHILKTFFDAEGE